MNCSYFQVSAALASRSGLNVYNIVMAMDRWLALNPTCYLGKLCLSCNWLIWVPLMLSTFPRVFT